MQAITSGQDVSFSQNGWGAYHWLSYMTETSIVTATKGKEEGRWGNTVLKEAFAWKS